MPDLQPDVWWRRDMYLSEHWGTTMAKQDAFVIDEFRARVEASIKDLLVNETFSPKTLVQELSAVAIAMKTDAHKAARQAAGARRARLDLNGGCPTCADSRGKPDPMKHKDFHERMTGKPLEVPAE